MKKSHELTDRILTEFQKEGIEFQDAMEAMIASLASLTVTVNMENLEDMTVDYYRNRCRELRTVKEQMEKGGE
jgi:hypothetical protein